MTVQMSGEHDRGEQAEGRRRRRKLIRSIAMIVTGVVFIWLVPTNSTSTPLARWSVGAFFAIAAGVLLLSWGDRDEVERRITTNSLAVIGLASIFFVPIATMLLPNVAGTDPATLGWTVSAIGGLMAMATQRIFGVWGRNAG